MAKVYLRKHVGKKGGGQKIYYCEKNWKNAAPTLTDDAVKEFIVKFGDGSYQFIKDSKVISIFKVKNKGFKARITETGRLFRANTHKTKGKTIHCPHCFNLGKKSLEGSTDFDRGYKKGYEVGYKDGYDKCVDDTDKAFREVEEEEEEEEYDDKYDDYEEEDYEDDEEGDEEGEEEDEEEDEYG